MSSKSISQPDYIFLPSATPSQRLASWTQTHRSQLREAGRYMFLLAIAFLVMKGLVLLGLVFQFLLPLSVIAAVILGIAQATLTLIFALLAVIAACATIGITLRTIWRAPSTLRRRLAK